VWLCAIISIAAIVVTITMRANKPRTDKR
jgi:hypothetical protein